MEKWQEEDMRLNSIIEKAVSEANRIIGEGSDGSVEETSYLTAMVAKRMMDSVFVSLIVAGQRHMASLSED